ncbi:NAD(P)-dependent alcohol dehydrogenase [bacterium]|nr:NAD(P)-dependent alcohol dehydrogenase [bacterium]
MKAIMYREYGGPEVLTIEEKETPVPKDDEVLIRTHATTVNYGDLLARNFKALTPAEFNMPGILWPVVKLSFGVSRPKNGILGSEFSGVVEAAGNAVTKFKPGDEVFGYLGQSMGAYGEYFCMKESAAVALKPSNLSHEEAAVLPYGAVMALHLLRSMDIKKGDRVLIVGASGSMGSAGVQIAKHYGAHVTGVCGPSGMDFVSALGADHVINYREEDFTEGSERYDLIFDVLGRSEFSRNRRVLKEHGRQLNASFKSKQLFQMLWSSIAGKQKIVCKLAPGGQEDLLAVRELIEAGAIRPVMDRVFEMSEAAAAHRHLEEGKKSGHVAIRMIATAEA